MPTPQQQLPLPLHLQHKPIFALPFFNHDPDREGATDCQFLSVGWSQWDDKEVSAKIFRHGDQKWSRQSEEVPLSRLVDLVSFVVLSSEIGNGLALPIQADFFENQPERLEIRRQSCSDKEWDFYRRSLLENEILQRRLDKLTDALLARRHAREAGV